MMRMLVDSDVVIAAMAKGEAQTEDSMRVMQGLLDQRFQGVATPVIMANIQYILGRKWERRKKVPDRERVVKAMGILLPLFNMIPMAPADFYASMASGFEDLEDGFQHFAALHSGKVDGIITCNPKDFKPASQLTVYEPGEFAATFL